MDDSYNNSFEEAIQYSKKYLEDLLSFFGLNTDVYATTEDSEVIELNVPSTHLNGFLIGAHGDTMRSLQYLISMALKNQHFTYNRVNVDVADYKRNRADRLAKQAEFWFKEVQDSSQPKELVPMNPADRRVVHKAANDFGIETESVGEGRDRHIVLKPTEPKAKSPELKAEQAKDAKPKAKDAKPKPEKLEAVKARLEKPIANPDVRKAKAGPRPERRGKSKTTAKVK